MKTAIVYYSMEENTDFVAKKIAEKTGADLIRLFPKKAYPDKGFRKFAWGGTCAVMSLTPELEKYSFKTDDYERIIIAFPVWASRPAPPISTFIKENDISSKRISAFACQAGSGAEKAFEKLKSAIGISKLENQMILIDPKAKPSEENEEKINKFCEELEEG